MKKKNILIAVLFATIMLLVPFTSISGGSISGFNSTVDDNIEAYPVILDDKFDELINLINQILAKYGLIQEVVEICNKILGAINSIYLNSPLTVICAILLDLVKYFLDLSSYYEDLYEASEPHQIFLQQFYIYMIVATLAIAVYVAYFGTELGCWVPPELESETGLNLQINPESILEYDIKTITEFFKSYELNGCPCMYE